MYQCIKPSVKAYGDTVTDISAIGPKELNLSMFPCPFHITSESTYVARSTPFSK